MKICKVKNCNNKHYARGYCINHYHSRIFYPRFKNGLTQRKSNKICSIIRCNKRHFAKGYCRNHYANYLRCGNPLGKPPRYKIVKCTICSKNIRRTPCQLKNRKHSFCSLKCFAKWHRGKNNPRWNGGNSEYPNHYLMKKRRLIILMQNPKCEICKKPAIEIHHRNGNKADHRLSNLMASCRSCNVKIRFKPTNCKYRRLYGMTPIEMAQKYGKSKWWYRIRHTKGTLKEILFTLKLARSRLEKLTSSLSDS